MITQSKSTAAKGMLASLALGAMLCGSADAAPLEFKTLILLNNWERYSVDTGVPAVALDSSNVVHLKGAMFQATGSNAFPFLIPPKFRPNRIVFVSVDLINGRSGRLGIQPNGTVFVQAAGTFSDAQNFTSLEGVTYSKN
jgi:hypothetical protein